MRQYTETEMVLDLPMVNVLCLLAFHKAEVVTSIRRDREGHLSSLIGQQAHPVCSSAYQGGGTGKFCFIKL